MSVSPEEISQMAACADELLATQPPPEALALWAVELLDFLQVKQDDMAEDHPAVTADGEHPFRDLRVHMLNPAARLLSAAGLADAIGPDDLLVALHGISLGSGDPEQARRIAGVLLAGLRS
jgi:hypothetical protein